MECDGMSYLPGKKWATQTAALSGFDADALNSAFMTARDTDIKAGPDLSEMLPDGSRHPNDRPLGPLKSRGSPSGVVVRHGRLVGQYGGVVRPEVTFSVSKSYLSALAGIASRDGLIGDVDEPVSRSVTDGGFDSEHNRRITWRHLLQQTSEWEGELFGLPDWIDRGRQVSGPPAGREKTIGGSAGEAGKQYRSLTAPGTFWEYNDVRVNRTALALLRLFREPLPAVLRREIMDPISATDSWTWHGYRTSWVDVAGRDMESVSGGAHWGGGVWINTLDHARFGLLYLHQGQWGKRRILDEAWIAASTSPCDINPAYGYLWWLNANGSISSIADSAAFAARGAGGHIVFIWPSADIVIVLRWCADPGMVIDRILGSLNA